MKNLDLFSNIRKHQPTLTLQALQKQWVGWVWPTGYTVCPGMSVQAQSLNNRSRSRYLSSGGNMQCREEHGSGS